MQWSATFVVLAAMVYGGGGVTKTSGIDQFWTDDYKVFDQVYGKTSDKEIYGDTLPLSVTFLNDKKKEASEKHERYLINYNDPDAEQYDTHNLGDRYKNLIAKPSLKLLSKKPATPSVNFFSYSNSFKPISQTNNPEMYHYLKHLEEFNKEDNYEFPKTVGGFKPYMGYEVVQPEESEAYKSIQEILDAHEANKGYKVEEENSMKYLTYPKSKNKKPPRIYNEVNKPRCTGNRCRTRGVAYRSRSRPYRRTPGVKTVVVI